MDNIKNRKKKGLKMGKKNNTIWKKTTKAQYVK